MIRAIVFDFDGLILETEEPIFRSWQELYAQYGFQLPLEQWVTTIGTSQGSFDPYLDLEKLADQDINWDVVEPARRMRELALIAQQPILPGVKDYLQDAGRLGLKIGLASSSTCQWVEGHLKQRGLLSFFDVLRASDDVRKTKPDPELYLAVMEALGIPTQQAIAFEDSPNGIRAAKAAGMYCVAVPNDLTRQLGLHQADIRLESLEDIPLEYLINMIDKRF